MPAADWVAHDMRNLELPVWPANQRVLALDPTIGQTWFADLRPHHGPIVERILKEEAEAKRLNPAGGHFLRCSKIRRPDLWGLPEFDLLNARALALFRHVLKTDKAAVDACWANVYRKWATNSPHSHRRAVASLVYCVDEGDPDPENPESGQFAIVDPRVKACCPLQEGCMTDALCPDFRSGAMLIFPGQTLHYVKNYTGERPRITVSWNINPEPLEGSPADRKIGQ